MSSNKKIIFYDSFDIKSDRWKEDTFSYYSNGTYHMYPRGFTNNYSWVSLHLSHSFKNFIFESEVEWLSGRDNVGFGLAFRALDTENTYVFSITKNKYYSIGILKNGKYEILYDWHQSDLIKDINLLGIACVNNCISAYVNEINVAGIVKSEYEKGFFGFFSSANVHSRYNNVRISEINEELLALP